MDFLQSTSVEELSQNHIEQLLKLEDQEALRVLKSYKQVRQDLRDRLQTTGEGTFTAQQMRGALFQIDQALTAMANKLRDDMKSSSENMAGIGAEDLLREINIWNTHFNGSIGPINLDVALVASDTSNLLFNKYTSSLSSYTEALRAQFALELSNAAIGGLPTSQVVSRVSGNFQAEEWKLQRLVRTEMHNIYNVGKLGGMQELVDTDIPKLKKTLFHPMDKRTGKDSIRLNKNNPIVNVDEEFVETSTGSTKRYMAPPNRPNDRAILIPYHPSWGN